MNPEILPVLDEISAVLKKLERSCVMELETANAVGATAHNCATANRGKADGIAR